MKPTSPMRLKQCLFRPSFLWFPWFPSLSELQTIQSIATMSSVAGTASLRAGLLHWTWSLMGRYQLSPVEQCSFNCKYQTLVGWRKKRPDKPGKTGWHRTGTTETTMSSSFVRLAGWLFSVSAMLCFPMVATSFLFSLEPVSDCKSLEQPIASVWSLGHFIVELLRPSRFHEASSLEFLDSMGCQETMALHGTNASITFSHPFCHMDHVDQETSLLI